MHQQFQIKKNSKCTKAQKNAFMLMGDENALCPQDSTGGLERIVLSETSQAENDELHPVSLLCGI